MQLTPRYGDTPLVVIDVPPADVSDAAIRQRARLADAVAGFGARDWARPSRCAGWTCRDVILHLDGTNAFWTYSIAAGVRGEPSAVLADFDPVATPAQLVAASEQVDEAALVERFRASTAALTDLLASLGDDDWRRTAESPAGHVSILAVAHHALWDSWVHERDVLVPLGAVPEVRDDEVVAALRYAAALSPGLALMGDPDRTGVLAVSASSPACDFHVEVDGQVRLVPGAVAAADVTLSGDAVELLEALSVRRPLDQDVPARSAWLVDGLRDTFRA